METELSRSLIEKLSKISKKVSKDNNIPFSAFDEIFKNPNNVAQLLTLLHFGNEQNINTSIKDISLKQDNQTEQKEHEKIKGLKR